MRLLGKSFHTLINGGLFSSPTNVGHHNPPPFGAQLPRWHSFLPPIDVGPPPNPPPLGPSVLTGTPPRVYPPSGNSEKADTSYRCGTTPKSTSLWGPASLLAHLLVSTPLRRTTRRLAQCRTSQSTPFVTSYRCGTAPKSTSLWRPASLLAHLLVSTPLRETTRRLTQCGTSQSTPFEA